MQSKSSLPCVATGSARVGLHVIMVLVPSSCDKRAVSHIVPSSTTDRV